MHAAKLEWFQILTHRKWKMHKSKAERVSEVASPSVPSPSYTGPVLAEDLALYLDSTALRHEVRHIQGKLTTNQN